MKLLIFQEKYFNFLGICDILCVRFQTVGVGYGEIEAQTRVGCRGGGAASDGIAHSPSKARRVPMASLVAETDGKQKPKS